MVDKAVKMNSEEILNRIQTLPKGAKFQIPEKVFYSGPNYSEEAIYYGNNKRYKDLIEFWISVLCWVSMDSIEYDDITIFNERNEYPPKINFCEEIELESDELKRMINKIKSLDEFSRNIQIVRCFKMSQEWDDKKYIFDCDENFFLFNWYTGE